MKKLMMAVVAACAAVGAMADYTPTWRGLPNGYTQVEYVESDGTQYVDLGITLYLFANHNGTGVNKQSKSRCYTLKIWRDNANGRHRPRRPAAAPQRQGRPRLLQLQRARPPADAEVASDRDDEGRQGRFDRDLGTGPRRKARATPLVGIFGIMSA